MKFDEILNEGRVEDFAIKLEQMWIKKLEGQITRYSENKDKSEEWNEGAQWVLRKIYARNRM